MSFKAGVVCNYCEISAVTVDIAEPENVKCDSKVYSLFGEPVQEINYLLLCTKSAITQKPFTFSPFGS